MRFAAGKVALTVHSLHGITPPRNVRPHVLNPAGQEDHGGLKQAGLLAHMSSGYLD